MGGHEGEGGGRDGAGGWGARGRLMERERWRCGEGGEAWLSVRYRGEGRGWRELTGVKAF